jgi:ATP-dependent RNA helicase RhlE
MQFNELPISNGTKDAVAAMGYEETTPIQGKAIEPMLKGRDVIGRARTGTGKTAAFGIPLVEALRENPASGVRALVLVPTRELALQVSGVLTDIARGSGIRVLPIYGGAGFDGQIRGLRAREPIAVVACPGRLLDLVQRGDADLRHVKFLILDEADRMLDMGFIHDIRRILKLFPRCQTGLFSATLEGEVRRLANDLLRDPISVEAEDGAAATPLTEQFHFKVEKADKSQALLGFLHQEQPGKAVVFTRTKHLAKRLSERLNGHGWSSVALQGNMSQNQRERAMEAFRKGEARIMVATDVAARGLDVPDITHVVNYDLPNEPEAYVHRIGRTGRNGRPGRSCAFVQSDEHTLWRQVERVAGSKIPAMQVGADAPRGPDASFAQAVAPQQRRRRVPGPGPSGAPRAPRQGRGNGRASGASASRNGSSHSAGSGRSNGGARSGGRSSPSAGRPHAGGRSAGRSSGRSSGGTRYASGGRSGYRSAGGSGSRGSGGSGGSHSSY